MIFDFQPWKVKSASLLPEKMAYGKLAGSISACGMTVGVGVAVEAAEVGVTVTSGFSVGVGSCVSVGVEVAVGFVAGVGVGVV